MSLFSFFAASARLRAELEAQQAAAAAAIARELEQVHSVYLLCWYKSMTPEAVCARELEQVVYEVLSYECMTP
jgi:hypothetical protein